MTMRIFISDKMSPTAWPTLPATKASNGVRPEITMERWPKSCATAMRW